MPELGIIKKEKIVLKKFGNLYQNPNWSDVTLVVENTKLIAHRLILGSHSKVFETLFGNDFSEFQQKEVKIVAPVEAFKILLQYLYTGSLNLQNHDVGHVAELLELCHRFDINEIEKEINDYLCVAVDTKNAVKVLQIAKLFDLFSLEELCWGLIEMTVEKIYEIELHLPYVILAELVFQRGRRVSEVSLFKIVDKMTKSDDYCEAEEKTELFEGINYQKMNAVELFSVVKPTNHLDPVKYIKLIEDLCCEDAQKRVKGLKLHRKITLYYSHNDDFKVYADWNDEFNHFTSKKVDGLVQSYFLIDLESIYTFNCLVLDVFRFKTGYIVKASKDNENWEQILDHCDIWNTINTVEGGKQNIYFPEVRARYIKIIGNPLKQEYIETLEAFFDPKPKKSFAGFIVPDENIFDQSLLQLTSKGNVYFSNVKNFKKAPYFTYEFKDTDLKVCLFQPCVLDSCRFRLWSCDGCKYSYTVYVSIDFLGTELDMISDKSDVEVEGWQTINFSPRLVKYFVIKATATFGDEIRISDFETPVKAIDEN